MRRRKLKRRSHHVRRQRAPRDQPPPAAVRGEAWGQVGRWAVGGAGGAVGRQGRPREEGYTAEAGRHCCLLSSFSWPPPSPPPSLPPSSACLAGRCQALSGSLPSPRRPTPPLAWPGWRRGAPVPGKGNGKHSRQGVEEGKRPWGGAQMAFLIAPPPRCSRPPTHAPNVRQAVPVHTRRPARPAPHLAGGQEDGYAARQRCLDGSHRRGQHAAAAVQQGTILQEGEAARAWCMRGGKHVQRLAGRPHWRSCCARGDGRAPLPQHAAPRQRRTMSSASSCASVRVRHRLMNAPASSAAASAAAALPAAGAEVEAPLSGECSAKPAARGGTTPHICSVPLLVRCPPQARATPGLHRSKKSA